MNKKLPKQEPTWQETTRADITLTDDTWRRVYAGLAMQGLLAKDGFDSDRVYMLSKRAIIQADSLIKTLEEKK